MTTKLTPAQTEAFYGAYNAYRESKEWHWLRVRKLTLDVLVKSGLVEGSPLKITVAKGLSLAAELGFSARYEAEKRDTAAKQQSDEAHQAEYRKLLEIPDTIDPPHIFYTQPLELRCWTVIFTMDIIVSGHITLDDTVAYRIEINDARLESSADVVLFHKEMYAAHRLLIKLNLGLIGKAEAEPYKPSVLAMLPNKAVEP